MMFSPHPDPLPEGPEGEGTKEASDFMNSGALAALKAVCGTVSAMVQTCPS